MLRRAVLPALIASALAAPPPAHAAGDPIMPLDAVRPGMACVAKTVLRGTEITAFDARVDDIIRDPSDLRRSRLLVTVSGPAIDATGVGAGFSGSPVICPGADGVARIAGAISETIGAYGGKTVLATPIQAILGEPVDPPRQTASAARSAAVLGAARRLAEPLSIGGLTPAVGALLQRAARRAGRTLVLSPSATAGAAQAPATPFAPGSAVALGYATGDITAGAVGTVAYVDGNAVWALGHPFEGVGRRDLFLQSAYVYGVIDNPVAAGETATYKLAAPLGAVGTLRQDGVSAVVGRVGPPPAAYPLRVTVRDRDTGRLRSSVSQLADERSVGYPNGFSALSSLSVPATVDTLRDALGGSPVRQSADMCLRVRIEQRPKRLAFCNRYVGGGGDVDSLAAGPIAADVAFATELLDVFDASRLDVTGVEIGLRVRRGLALATLVSASGPRSVRRGSVLKLRARLRRPGGAKFTRTISVPVPRTMPRGARDVLLRGTDIDVEPTAGGDSGGFELSGLFDDGDEEDRPQPTSVAALAKEFSKLHRYDGVSARFVRRGQSAPVDLPGGAERIAQRSRRVFRDKSVRISGRARVRVRVR